MIFMERCQTNSISSINEALEIFPCHVNNVIFFEYYVTLFFIKEMTFAFEILVSPILYLDLVKNSGYWSARKPGNSGAEGKFIIIY
jgi:hypothetical protein